MRVHPDFLTPKTPAWRFPAYVAILLVLLGFTVVRGPSQVVNAVQSRTSPSELKLEAQVDSALREVEQQTVAVPLTFETLAPGRGARIALTLNDARGDTVVVIEDAWVSKSVGREVVLRLHPEQALVLQSARSYGSFHFIEIPSQGASPYIGKGVRDSDQLARLMTPLSAQSSLRPASRGKQQGYAWIPGESRGFGIADSGTIKPIGNQ
ncbi:MAG: hypothetical protein J0M12_00540 [Deltaproteobacteria bacterium]|nr:hypothetical protein [Deltaproteobacteria bacterium]